MKNIIFALAFIMTAVCTFTSCDDKENTVTPPSVNFMQTTYELVQGTPLTVEIKSSIPVLAKTSIPFQIGGTAEEGTHYTISAKEFTIEAGQSSATIEITPLENYTPDLNIELTLNAVSGIDLGTTSKATISVGAGEQIIYSFVKASDAMSGEVVIGIELKNMEGNTYIAQEDIHLPFVFAESSTAKLGTHFSVEGDATEFVILKGKRNATIKLKYIELQEGQDEIVMQINAGARFIPGNYEETKIKIYGPTTMGKLFGKWVYKSDNLQSDYIDTYGEWGWDLGKVPTNNSSSDTLEIAQGEEVMLMCHLSGDMKNYFRDATLTHLRDTNMRISSSTYITYPLMNLSKANAKFSASDVEERAVEVAFRIIEEDGSLEVTVYDYTPVDFFGEFYEDTLNYGYWLMWEARIQYIFTKVEETNE